VLGEAILCGKYGAMMEIPSKATMKSRFFTAEMAIHDFQLLNPGFP
jgi:hypothetical protein